MLGAETVDVVALFLELPALQVRQIIDGINIVGSVPVTAQKEFIGEPAFQFFPVCVRYTGNAAGDAPLFGIQQNFLQNCPAVAVADGVWVDGAAVEVGEIGHAAVEKGGLLAAPDLLADKRIFAAPGRAGEEDLLVLFFLREFQSMKIDHIYHILCKSS